MHCNLLQNHSVMLFGTVELYIIMRDEIRSVESDNRSEKQIEPMTNTGKELIVTYTWKEQTEEDDMISFLESTRKSSTQKEEEPMSVML